MGVPLRGSPHSRSETQDDQRRGHPANDQAPVLSTEGVAVMKTYRAVAKREDGWWIISVPELDVVTQARRIDQIEHMARDLIAAWLEVDYDEVAVTVDLRIPREWSAEAEIVRRAQEVAALANAEAAKAARRAAKRLHAQGLTVRDIGKILDVSPQRVSQLLKDPAPARASHIDLIEALTDLSKLVSRFHAASRRRKAPHALETNQPVDCPTSRLSSVEEDHRVLVG